MTITLGCPFILLGSLCCAVHRVFWRTHIPLPPCLLHLGEVSALEQINTGLKLSNPVTKRKKENNPHLKRQCFPNFSVHKNHHLEDSDSLHCFTSFPALCLHIYYSVSTFISSLQLTDSLWLATRTCDPWHASNFWNQYLPPFQISPQIQTFSSGVSSKLALPCISHLALSMVDSKAAIPRCKDPHIKQQNVAIQNVICGPAALA